MTKNETSAQAIALEAIDELKGLDVVAIDVVGKSSFTDTMIIVTGSSNRHVRSIADSVQRAVKQHGLPVIGIEGDDQAEWVLVDLADVVVHVMLRTVRDFYNLEKLWGESAPTMAENQSQP